MSQKQDISIAAEVMGTSSGDTPFFYQDLEHRIANTLLELEKKSDQLVTLEKEIGTLKASLVPILGLSSLCTGE